MEYRVISNRITAVEKDQVLGEITFPDCGPETVVIDHTWVDPSLRGQGVAGQLVKRAADALRFHRPQGPRHLFLCPGLV